MIKAFDCAQPLNSAMALRARDAGFLAVGRYYGTTGSAKLLLRGEVEIISGVGMMIFTYFERTPGRVLGGSSAGTVDGGVIRYQATNAGQPAGSGVCVAIDIDLDMRNPVVHGGVVNYFKAIKASLESSYRLGVYGEGDALVALTEAGVVDYQILAGAMGWRGSRAYKLTGDWEGLQYPETDDNPIGISIDPVDLKSFDAVGAWSRGKAPPVPVPDNAGITAADAVATASLLQRQLVALGLYTGEDDGQVGPMTSAAEMRAWRMTQA